MFYSYQVNDYSILFYTKKKNVDNDKEDDD